MIFKGQLDVWYEWEENSLDIDGNKSIVDFLNLTKAGQYLIEIEVFPKGSKKGSIIAQHISHNLYVERVGVEVFSYICINGLVNIFPSIKSFVAENSVFEANILKLERIEQ